MLIRPDGDAVICIGQPAHAFVSGQLAAAWRPRPEPFDEVVLAATQHDAGMADWDAEPELNPETGVPRSFMEMSLDTHLRLWTHAPHRVLTQSRYAALLVSMHGTALYEMRDLSKLDEAGAAAVTRYLDEQRELQARLAAGLDHGELRRNQQLVWGWDFLSLGLCLRWDDASVNDLTLYADTIEPWPFADDAIALHTDGRRLEGRYDSDAALHAALAEAPWVRLEFELSRRP
jgi:hypothetical protein